jgi:hypothetical protein
MAQPIGSQAGDIAGTAAMGVMSGVQDRVAAGGVQKMTQLPDPVRLRRRSAVLRWPAAGAGHGDSSEHGRSPKNVAITSTLVGRGTRADDTGNAQLAGPTCVNRAAERCRHRDSGS